MTSELPPKYYARAVLRLVALLGLVLLLFPPVLVLWMLTLEKLRARLVCWFHTCMRLICGIKLTVEGDISRARPLMIVSNHTSYLDIFILGSVMPLSFTPKREIRSWPVIGFFCVLADCVFIERKPAHMQEAKAEMEEKLRAGKVLTLFPEGTTGDGFNVMPFKSGFLQVVEDYKLPLQPVSLAYTHIGDQPLSATTRELVAWIGEASLITHLMRLLSFASISVTARFYPVQVMAEEDDRKTLAKAAEEAIRDGLKATLAANGVMG